MHHTHTHTHKRITCSKTLCKELRAVTLGSGLQAQMPKGQPDTKVAYTEEPGSMGGGSRVPLLSGERRTHGGQASPSYPEKQQIWVFTQNGPIFKCGQLTFICSDQRNGWSSSWHLSTHVGATALQGWLPTHGKTCLCAVRRQLRTHRKCQKPRTTPLGQPRLELPGLPCEDEVRAAGPAGDLR